MKKFLIPHKSLVLNEYIVLIIRIFILMVFYTVFRLLFYFFNKSMFPEISFGNLMYILYGGLKFDISAILYLNILYIFLYMLPFKPEFKFGKIYKRILKWIFITTNSIGLALNSIDIIYYRFILKRTTFNVKDILANEDNLFKLTWKFIIDFWYIALIFAIAIIILSYLYSLFQPKAFKHKKYWQYSVVTVIVLALFSGLSIAGMRGGFRHSTRPIAISNAGKYVEYPEQMAIVLNSPFSVIRTWNKKSYDHKDYFKSEEELNAIFNPVVHEDSTKIMNKKNVVIFILESFNREYVGSLNRNLDGGKYKGFTPFLDSLLDQGWAFTQAYANGRKSIDAMPSVIASIPSFVLPYVVSEYSTNHVNSLASLLDKKGYETAFFHGAPDGSMGFQSFAKLAGFKHYYGKEEYNNDDDFDGWWGIWDHKFFAYFANQMNKMKQPFFTTLFSLSSHHPFHLPEGFEGKYPKGPLPVNQCIAYSDDALRRFFNIAKKMPWYKNTLFVFTADHSMTSYYKYSHTSLGGFAIPILFYAPGDSTLKIKKDNRPMQQINIMPTILHYLNYNSDYLTFGNDMYGDKDIGVTIYVDNYFQHIHGDYVIYFDGEKVTGVYNYKKDHYLKNNLIDSVDYKKYELEVKAIIQQYNNRMIEDRLLP